MAARRRTIARTATPRISAATYRMLTGVDPAEAAIDDDDSFDRHVLASILAVAADGERRGRRAGGPRGRRSRAPCWRDGFLRPPAWPSLGANAGHRAEDDEIAMVRELLLANRSSDGDIGRCLAAMIARRAMEPNHLWEDLGLRDRTELTGC